MNREHSSEGRIRLWFFNCCDFSSGDEADTDVDVAHNLRTCPHLVLTSILSDPFTNLQPWRISVYTWTLQMCPLWPFAFRFHASFPLEEGCCLHSLCQRSAICFQAEMSNKSYFMYTSRLFQRLCSVGLRTKLERWKKVWKAAAFISDVLVTRPCRMIWVHIRSAVQSYYQWADSYYPWIAESFTMIT